MSSGDKFVARQEVQIRQIAVGDGSHAEVIATLPTADEDMERGWRNQVCGATMRKTVLPGKTNFVLGSGAGEGDYLHLITAVVSTPSNSQVILRDGLVTPVLSSTTHASTPSTTTVVNTATIAAALSADQYKGYVISIGAVQREIASHPATAGNAVAAFTLDHALPTAPAASAAFSIEAPDTCTVLLPAGMAVGTYSILIDLNASIYHGVTTDTGVKVIAHGDFQ